MPEPLIRDPAIYQWRYFLRWWGNETEADRVSLAGSFGAALQASLNWVGEPVDEAALGKTLRQAVDPAGSQVSERLSTVDWRERQGYRRALEARTLLDTFYVELGQEIPGARSPNALRTLESALPELEEPPDAYLGQAICLYGEADGNLTAVAEAMAQAYTSSATPSGQIESFLFPWGSFAIVPDADVETMVVVANEPGSPDVGRLLHSVLPQLLLSRVKVRVVRKGYYADDVHRAREAESGLEAALQEAARPRLGLENLERVGARIAREQASLIEAMSDAEERIETVRISIRNLELVLQDPLWGDEQQRLGDALIGEQRLLLEQIEADLRYLKITRQRADLALVSLQAAAGVRAAKWERRLTLVLAFFVMTGVASAFPEIEWYWRVAIILAGLPLVAVGYWLLRRSEGDVEGTEPG